MATQLPSILISTASLLVSGFISGAALYTSWYALRLNFPTKMEFGTFHLFETDKGKPYNPDNPVPPLKKGTRLTAAAFVHNVGRENANVVAANFILYITDKDHLPMVSPVRRDETSESTKKLRMLDGNGVGHEPATVLKPDDFAGWQEEVELRKDLGAGTLYILGYLRFEDGAKVRHTLTFARKYDPAMQAFVRVTDAPDYDSGA